MAETVEKKSFYITKYYKTETQPPHMILALYKICTALALMKMKFQCVTLSTYMRRFDAVDALKAKCLRTVCVTLSKFWLIPTFNVCKTLSTFKFLIWWSFYDMMREIVEFSVRLQLRLVILSTFRNRFNKCATLYIVSILEPTELYKGTA